MNVVPIAIGRSELQNAEQMNDEDMSFEVKYRTASDEYMSVNF